MSRKISAVLIVILLVVLLIVWNWFSTPDIEIRTKWITAKVTCPEKTEVESIVLLEPKGYRVVVYLRKDPKLLEHLKSNRKELVSLFVESRRSGSDLVEVAEYPVSLAGYKLDRSSVLNLRNRNCSLGDIEGHK